MLLIIIWYIFHNYFWPRPQSWPRSSGLGLEVLASFNITAHVKHSRISSAVYFQFQTLVFFSMLVTHYLASQEEAQSGCLQTSHMPTSHYLHKAYQTSFGVLFCILRQLRSDHPNCHFIVSYSKRWTCLTCCLFPFFDRTVKAMLSLVAVLLSSSHAPSACCSGCCCGCGCWPTVTGLDRMFSTATSQHQ